MDETIARIDRDLRDRENDGDPPETIRLEVGLWRDIRRAFNAQGLRYAERPLGPITARPRLFGFDVVVDETLAPGTWRLEPAR